MESLLENEVFRTGIAVGINIYQKKVVSASQHKEPLNIDGESYYIKNSAEQLQEVIERACK